MDPLNPDLPARRPDLSTPAEREWWGDTVTTVRCSNSGRTPAEVEERESTSSPTGTLLVSMGQRIPAGHGHCRSCEGLFPLTADGSLPEHAKPLNVRELAEYRITEVATSLGFDAFDADVLSARSMASENRPGLNLDLRIAAGLSVLSLAIAKRGSISAQQVADPTPGVTASTPEASAEARTRADAVYSVLVEEVGANEHWRADCTFHLSRFLDGIEAHHGSFEYRLMGAVLGFGGKLRCAWRHGRSRQLYVDCYPEDVTPERTAAIEAANARLDREFNQAA